MLSELTIKWMSVEPELQIIFTAPRGFRLTEEKNRFFETRIASTAKSIFLKKFTTNADIEVAFVQETMKVRIRPYILSVPDLLAQYAAPGREANNFAEDMRQVWRELQPEVIRMMAGELNLRHASTMRIKGAIERVDQVCHACDAKRRWDDVDLSEAKANFSVLYYSKDRKHLVPAVNKYLDAIGIPEMAPMEWSRERMIPEKKIRIKVARDGMTTCP